jgi:hypothetical protein
MTKLFTLILTALALCACSAEVGDEPIGETTQALAACDPFVTEPYIPATNWVAFDIANFGSVACVAADDARFSVTTCSVWSNGQTTNCANEVANAGPVLLAKVAQPGWIQNTWVSDVPCRAWRSGDPSNFLGQRVTALVKWKVGTTTKTRTASHNCY